MRATKSTQFSHDDIGGAIVARLMPLTMESATDLATEEDEDSGLYAAPIDLSSTKKHSVKSVNQRMKAKRIAEDRLNRLSEELSKLADEIRYLNPLMAEMIDEAWEATEDAIAMLSDDHVW